MSPHEAIKRYYACFRERRKEELRNLLTPDFHHVSSFGEHTERDEMIEAIWPSVGSSWAEDIQILGEYPDFMVHFTTVSKDRAAMRMAEWIRFRGEKIAAIEVFMGRELAVQFRRNEGMHRKADEG